MLGLTIVVMVTKNCACVVRCVCSSISMATVASIMCSHMAAMHLNQTMPTSSRRGCCPSYCPSRSPSHHVVLISYTTNHCMQAPTKFSFASCKYAVQRCKEATGRVVTWRLGVPNSFTLEATFCGSNLGPVRYGMWELRLWSQIYMWYQLAVQ